MAFLPFDVLTDDADLAAFLALHNQVWYFQAETADEWRSSDRSRPSHAFHERYVVYGADGHAHTIGTIDQRLMAKDRSYWLSVHGTGADPEAGGRLLTHLIHRTLERGADNLMGCMRSDRPCDTEPYELAGFEIRQRNPVTELDLTRWQPPEAEIPAGIEIMTLAQAAQMRGEGWRYEFWELVMEVFRDVPSPTPPQPMSFADFCAFLGDPNFSMETRFVAMADGAMVGLSEFHLSPGSDFASTHLTGVLRSYRRQGIARALKVRALQSARERGARRIATDNEEQNPMYQLNLQLGFQWVFDTVVYVLPEHLVCAGCGG